MTNNELVVHFRYMKNGAACNPTLRKRLTDQADQVTCKNCSVSLYFKNKKEEQASCPHKVGEELGTNLIRCVSCSKHMTFKEFNKLNMEGYDEGE